MSTEIFKTALAKLDLLVEKNDIPENDYMHIADALKKGYDAEEENSMSTSEIHDMKKFISSLFDEMDQLREDLKCAYSLLSKTRPQKRTFNFSLCSAWK